jgi:hypothetical protein
MSHFYGYLTGNRGTTTRGGSKDSGISAHIRSWQHDVYARLCANCETGEDYLSLDLPQDKDLTIRINHYTYKFNKEGILKKVVKRV